MKQCSKIVEDLTLPEGWTIEFLRPRAVYSPTARSLTREGPRIYISMSIAGNSIPGGPPVDQLTKTSGPLPDDFTVEATVDFIRELMYQVVCHEVDEWLRYRGKLVHDPHQGPDPVVTYERIGRFRKKWRRKK